MRRLIARTLTVALTASVLTASFTTAALAVEPSVPLPGTASTPVSEQKMGSRGQDQASREALTGDQTAGTPAPEGGGNPGATPLSPSSSWDVSAHTGDFTWSYPLRVPPSPGGFAPDLALGYSSSGVDGRTSATNNQASWVGDGWDLSVGFVERRYLPCADDKIGGTTPPKESGDLCWRSDNAMAVYGSGGGELIRDDATGQWRAQKDDGSRIERLTTPGNGDNDGESWRITTPDGTQYLFGSRADAKSTWTVPVFGDDVGEPCHGADFAASMCKDQAWRWNLDKVIDRHGNVIVYNYAPETNSYGANNKDTAVPYVRGGTLLNAQYGLRDGQAQATGLVEFTLADRCVPGSDCKPEKKDNWPDVPWDSKCDTATCADKHGPTFWSTKRLDKVTTKVWNGSGYSEVERWTLEHAFPASGDGEKAALWLKGITHTGLAGTPISLPQVTFEGTKMPNRVKKDDGVGPLLRYRITGIVSESGGVTTINYSKPECVDGVKMPANAESNTLRCYPMKWAKKDHSERTDHFHKYVVDSVVQSDRISSNIEQVSSYAYRDGTAWAWDDSEFTEDSDRNWNQFRGYAKVEIRQGKPGDPSGPVTLTEKRFYRGMHGDKLPSGTREVKFGDSENGVRTDDEWLRGFEYESRTYDGESDRLVSKSITWPSVQGPTATRGTLKAHIVGTGTEYEFTTLAAGGRRTTKSETTYDDRGLPLTSNDLGDITTAADDKCARTTYARNTDLWLLDPVARVETVAVACTATPVFPRDALSDTRNAFDGKGFGVPPTKGDVTRTEVAKERPAAGPVWALSSTAGFDAYGRTTSSGNALGHVTTTKYTPATGVVKDIEATNPAGHTTKTTVEPFFGQETVVVDANNRTTQTTYDALGRKSEVWLPNRYKEEGETGNVRFAYNYRKDAPTVVTTTTLGPNGHYTTVNELYDGLLRLRQTQEPAVGGGRLIVDARFDSQGRKYKTTMPYFTDSAVDDKLWVASDADIASHTVREFDGAGRESAVITKGGAAEKWRTTYRYGGDRTHVTPPAGGTATTTIEDARGRKVELLQYRSESEYDSTKYTYTAADQLATVTGPAGSVWRNTYDLRGRKVKEENPDRGTGLFEHDDAGQVVRTTDAKGTVLTHEFDALGRKRKLLSGTTVLAEWTYDTVARGKGMLAASTRYVGGAAYTSQVLGYSALSKPTGTTVTIPQTEQTLAGTYTSRIGYNVDGSVASTTFPAIGGLAEEPVRHSYDHLGHATTTSAGLNGTTEELVTGTEYTRYGELARTQLGNEGKRVWLSRYYDTNTRRLERTIVDAEVPNPKQTDTRFGYDNAGNLTSVVDGADAQCFRMDHLQRLTEAWTPSNGCAGDPAVGALGGPAPYWHSYTYDKEGNRLTETQHAAGGDVVRTGAHTGHRVDSVQTKSPSGTKTDTFGYDAAGNTTTRGAQQLDYDAEGRLAKVTEAGKVTEFVHDADGNRLIRRDPVAITLNLGDQELRLVRATGKLEPTRYYQHGGATVAMRDAKGLTWLASDHQNTAQVAINSGDLSVTRRRQLPFGGARGEAAFPGEKGFVGGTIDASTGLVQLGARSYDPALGRFLSVDAVTDAADPQQMHGYAYANNSPITKSDPSGLLWEIFGNAVKHAKAGFKVLEKGFHKANKLIGEAVEWGWEQFDKNKSWISLGLSIAAIAVGPVGWVSLGLSVASTALAAWDMAQQHKANNAGNVAAGAGGLVLGLLSRGLTSSVYQGVTKAGVAADRLDKAGVVLGYANAAGLTSAPGTPRVLEAMPAPPPPVTYGAGCPSQANEVGVFGNCSIMNLLDPKRHSYCGQFPKLCGWGPKDQAKPGLGTRSYDDSPLTGRCDCGGKKGGKKGGKSGGSNYPTAPNGDYKTPDDLWHRPDGKGWAYF